jgi:hypothetical protein
MPDMVRNYDCGKKDEGRVAGLLSLTNRALVDYQAIFFWAGTASEA